MLVLSHNYILRLGLNKTRPKHLNQVVFVDIAVALQNRSVHRNFLFDVVQVFRYSNTSLFEFGAPDAGGREIRGEQGP